MVGRRVSRECFEQLHTWVIAHCACALEEPEFVPGLVAIVKLERPRPVGLAGQNAPEDQQAR